MYWPNWRNRNVKTTAVSVDALRPSCILARMAKLSNDQRKALLDRTFGLPAQRKYPMPDASHARNAKARASQQFNAGRLSKGQKTEVDRKADAKLGDVA